MVGCNSTPATSPDQSGDATTDEPSKDTDNSNDYPNGLSFADMKNAEVFEKPEEITTLDADGNPAAWYTDLSLTKEELEKVRSMNLKACFELINESEWDGANLIGFQEACDAMNIEIVAQGNCNLDPITQKNNMESFMAARSRYRNLPASGLRRRCKHV